MEDICITLCSLNLQPQVHAAPTSSFHLHNHDPQGGGYLQLSRIPARGKDGSIAFFTYHVLYSPSYRVPVLHFTAHDAGRVKVTAQQHASRAHRLANRG